MKNILYFLLVALFTLTVLFTSQPALAHHEDENCADWGTCDDYNPPYYDPCSMGYWWDYRCW